MGHSFDDSNRQSFEFDNFLVSDDIAFGEGTEQGKGEYSLDGVCLSSGTMYIYQKYKRDNIPMRTYNCIAGPNYICGVDNMENKFFLMPEQGKWKGFFTLDEVEIGSAKNQRS